MKTNGSVYVAVVFAVLIGYFGYQWWLNPARAVKRRLGEVAATLSMPASESQMARVARLAQLRRYLAENIHVRAGASGRELTARDEVLAVAAGWRPSEGGWDVHFADLQSGYGRLVVISHANGISTRYGHLSKIEVAVGDAIQRGQQPHRARTP